MRKIKKDKKYRRSFFKEITTKQKEECKKMIELKNCSFKEECLGCVFDKRNTANGVHCLKNGFSSKVSDEEEDLILVNSCKFILRLS